MKKIVMLSKEVCYIVFVIARYEMLNLYLVDYFFSGSGLDGIPSEYRFIHDLFLCVINLIEAIIVR